MRPLLPALLLACATTAAAQTPDYTPIYQMPKGRQIVAVYVGSLDCRGCMDPATHAAIHQMKPLVAAQAQQGGAAFSAIAVSLDWATKDGMAFLAPLGTFDEILAGGNWSSIGAQRFIWSDTDRAPSIPQVLIIERTVQPASKSVAFTPDKVLRRVLGATEIAAWARKGAPIRD